MRLIWWLAIVVLFSWFVLGMAIGKAIDFWQDTKETSK